MVKWGCEPRVSRGLVQQLGLDVQRTEHVMKVRAVQMGLGGSKTQLWAFEVVDDAEAWLLAKALLEASMQK